MRTIRLALGFAFALGIAAPALAADPSPPAPADAAPLSPSALVPPGAGDVHAAKLDSQYLLMCISATDTKSTADFYRDVFEKDGWRETSDIRDGRERTLSFGKGEKGEVMLTLNPKGGGTAVLLIITGVP